MSEDKNGRPEEETNYTGLGVGLGLLFGTALGLILWQATDSVVFFPVFVGAGLSIGVALGVTRDQQKSD
jgi:hypothetical protein